MNLFKWAENKVFMVSAANVVRSEISKSAQKGKGVWGWLLACHAHCTVHCPRPEGHCPTVDSCFPGSPTPVTHKSHYLDFLWATPLTGLVSHSMQPSGKIVFPRRTIESASFSHCPKKYVYAQVTKPCSSCINYDRATKEVRWCYYSATKSTYCREEVEVMDGSKYWT